MTQWLKKICFLVLLSTGSFLSAEGSLQIRSAAFFPLSDRFQDVYGDIVVDFQVQGEYTIRSSLNVWGNVDWFTKSKSSFCCKSKICQVNGSVGLNYVKSFNEQLDIYCGLGVAYGETKLHNKSCDEHAHVSKYTFGLVVKSGFQYDFYKNLFLDVFVDYLYQPVHFHHRTVDVGGFKTGAGLGFRF